MLESPRFTVNELSKFPENPGVYCFYNAEGVLIYVGKAKSLKKRVSSYFNKNRYGNRKTFKLVSEIKAISFTLVNTEFDALLLENNLIKSYQPKYNILLKDDKSFPYICVTNEDFPRIYSTRRLNRSKGIYFGPYANVKAMNAVLHLIRDLYHIRTCTLNLSPSNIEKKKFKVCLEYHLGNCKGPCENLQSAEEYNAELEQAKDILKGHTSIIRQTFLKEMRQAAEELNYERAQHYKVKLDRLEHFQSKSIIVNPSLTNIEVAVIVSDEKKAFVNYMYVHQGTIISSQTVEIKKKLNETDQEILPLALVHLRPENVESTELLCNIEVDDIDDLKVTVPKIGDKKKLIEMAASNALFYKQEKYLKVKKEGSNQVLEELKRHLHLKTLPEYIECFDNSNLQGTNPVASMVCFKKGKPSKKDYRHYNIKTVVGPDDFASMTEVVGRRYKKLLEEKQSLPDLVIIDGGKGQLSAACDALKELGLYGQIPLIGIAKRLEELYVPEDSFPLHIDKKSTALKLIQQIRDEAHRFAINFHRQKRSKQSIITELQLIEGIGDKTINQLLSTFGSVAAIKKLSLDEMCEAIGVSRGTRLYKYFNP